MRPDPTHAHDSPAWRPPDDRGASPPIGDKAALRRRLLAARRARGAVERDADARALADGLPALVAALAAAGPLCLHVPVGSEPGAAADGSVPLLAAAWALGRPVLLPVTVGAAALDWARCDGPDDLVPGPHGLAEPGGRRLGPDAVAGAGLVLVPALAVDRRGVRLGRGGGHYDRTLARTGPGPRVAMVGDDELVARLPAEAHDVRVDHVWRPRAGPSAVAPARPSDR